MFLALDAALAFQLRRGLSRNRLCEERAHRAGNDQRRQIGGESGCCLDHGRLSPWFN